MIAWRESKSGAPFLVHDADKVLVTLRAEDDGYLIGFAIGVSDDHPLPQVESLIRRIAAVINDELV